MANPFLRIVIISTLMVLSLLTGGCQKDELQIPAGLPMGVQSIKKIEINSRDVVFTCVCALPNPCYIYLRAEHQPDGFTIKSKLYCYLTTKNPCIQVITNIEVPVSFSLNAPGTYTFRFRASDSTSVDTSLTIR